MVMFSSPEEHAANPPSSWLVVKVADRCWHLTTKDGVVLEYGSRGRGKAATEALKAGGHSFRHYEDERRWYAGETVQNWRPYAEIKAEREARELAKEAK